MKNTTVTDKNQKKIHFQEFFFNTDYNINRA